MYTRIAGLELVSRRCTKYWALYREITISSLNDTNVFLRTNSLLFAREKIERFHITRHDFLCGVYFIAARTNRRCPRLVNGIVNVLYSTVTLL